MTTVGGYLARRLVQAGVERHFVVPGDYNLLLLDQLQNDPGLDEINCTNELNCSMAAEGYARAKGVSACVVTYSVGAFSAFNGVGSAYAENLPLILIVGSPSTNDFGTKHLLHHTLGTEDFDYELEMAKRITCAAVRIPRPSEAPHLIDYAIHEALQHKKPCYIEIPNNLASQPCPLPGPATSVLRLRGSDEATLEEATDRAAKFVEDNQKVTLVLGGEVRAARAEKAAMVLAEALGCAVCVMPNGKTFFPEHHPQFAGIYWGTISTRCANAIVTWSDAIINVGVTYTDYSSLGWTAVPTAKMMDIRLDRTSFDGCDYHDIDMADFLMALSKKVSKKPDTLTEYHRLKPDESVVPVAKKEEKLTRREMMRQVHGMVTKDTTLFVDTGDAWFNGGYLTLPDGARFEIEMQWGHIGWSVPACLGYAAGAPDRKILCLVGDGAFQVTCQEVANAVRMELPIIFILVNNAGYTIEVEIHDGIYNNIKDWDYSKIIECFNYKSGHGKGWKAKTAGELSAAIAEASRHKKGPSLIECCIDRDDCTKELITWGHAVAAANGKPPAEH